MREADAEREWPLLIRATDGNGKKDIKVKISTIVRGRYSHVRASSTIARAQTLPSLSFSHLGDALPLSLQVYR